MKKYLMTGIAAVAMGAAMTSCSHDFEPMSQEEINQIEAQKIVQTYEQAFIKTFGQPAANQNWGFGAAQARTRSMANPVVGDINAPYDEAWVADYLTTAKEPTQANTWDNFDNSSYAVNWAVVNNLTGDEWTLKDQLMNSGKSWEEQLAWMLENRPGWLTFNQDENYVTNFKITGTYDGYINVASSEGIMDGGTLSHAERTIVVTGTWNMTEDQKIGSLGKIIIANGGTVNVASGKTLNMVNQARLVVLPGGKLTGAGKTEVNNGNASGQENYNGGTIDVATFNNNFGKFYNYGKFLVNEYQGGAQESNFYNHALASIDHFAGTGSTANARIFNACQFYVKKNARIRNYEGVAGSALIVDGQLMFSSSEDGTSTPTYVGLAAGALVQAGSLYNNGTSWTGPTDNGYAVLSIGQFDYMNWEQDAPQNGGYFANNIYLVADDLTNVPDGNGYHQTDPSDTYNHSISIAEYKFKNIVANAVGNGNVTVAEKGTYEVIPADGDFVKGEAGCTPGFKIKKTDEPNDPIPSEPSDADLRIMAEDLSAYDFTDFDFNDVVFDVYYGAANAAKIVVKAAGGTLPLRIKVGPGTSESDYVEVHGLWGEATNIMINTKASYANSKSGLGDKEVTLKYAVNDATDARDKIIIEVEKKNEQGTVQWIPMNAAVGKPAAKFACSPDLRWADERESLLKNSNFKDWVQDAIDTWKWNDDIK